MEKYYNEFLGRVRGMDLGNMRNNDRANYAKQMSVLVSGTSGFAYIIDYINMVQTNEQTGRWRGVRRGENGGVLRISKKSEAVPWIPHPVLK